MKNRPEQNFISFEGKLYSKGSLIDAETGEADKLEYSVWMEEAEKAVVAIKAIKKEIECLQK